MVIMMKSSIQSIKGIGPKKAQLLAGLGITTLDDVLHYYPRDYEFVGALQSVSTVKPGDMVSLKIRFCTSAVTGRTKRGLNITTIKGRDKTGAVECIWHNQPYR